MLIKLSENSKRIYAAFTAFAVLLAVLLTFPSARAYAAGTDLYVGYSGRQNNFSTVQDAVSKAASLNPTSEEQRVTIHIAPGTYRQQVIVQTPYITFINDEPSKGDAVLTWYYGIGYKYYSANSKGYYDANAAMSKSAKNVANYRWGATVQLRSTATNFRAENIVFENSFNRYMTSEEVADGVECTNETLTVGRNAFTDVQAKSQTERAAALSADAGYCEFLNCKFLSSQDTLYAGASPQYYKNCLIEGQTDYIFGDCAAVFDSCELRWKGYSSGSLGGYITAERDENNDDTGYLFSNCKVTANPDLTVSTGYLGRPWRQSAKVMFINTTLANGNMITPEGWTSMSGVQPETVDGFKEYGTKLANGQSVDLSRRKGHTLSANDANNIKLENYMKNWSPSFLYSSGSSEQSQSGQQSDITPSVSDAIKTCGGWFEEAYVEWDSSKIGSNVKISYAPSGSSDFVQADPELIRSSRADIAGLKGNTEYTLKIEGSSGSAECTVKTMAYDRSGYAHFNTSSGVGAYNNDGTLKSGVQVIYVTNSNKDTITYGGKTGLYNIFYSAKPSNVVFRFIGNVGVPSGAKANDGQQNDGSSMLYLQNAENVTIEGIGYDANLDKWGFEMKRCKSIEVRNLWLGKYPDDGISMTGSDDNRSAHIWVHNNSLESGYNRFAGNGIVDDDKADGDGSTDIKWSEYVTISYNVYTNCHKTSLVGGGTNHFQDWITYHHNWFNGTESRNPRARNAHIHSYNNYFTNNKQYGIGASYNSKIFSEANYFEKTNLPLDAENIGSDAYSGTIKSYGDKFVSCNMGSGLAYQTVNSRNDKAYINNLKQGGDGYDNFDTDSSKIYGSYNVQSADAAKNEVMAYAGRMQNKAYNTGSATSGSQGTTQPTDIGITSALISNFGVLDYTYGSAWSVAENAKVYDKAFGDRDFAVTALPQTLAGSEHIITACDSKNTDADLAQFTALADVTVYVAIDSRVTNIPSWLGAYTNTWETLTITDSSAERTFNIYSRDFKAGENVTLGTNGQSSGVMNYTAYVKEKPVVTTVTTTTATTTTTTTTTVTTSTTTTTVSVEITDSMAGDANCDGKVNMSDVVLIMQSMVNPDKFGINGSDSSHMTRQGMTNGDVVGRDGITNLDALEIQKYLLDLVSELTL